MRNNVQDVGRDVSGLEAGIAYKKLFASSVDESVCWWYFGTVLVDIPGMPTLPVVQSETAMIYRVETVSAEQFRIHWREIGYFRDPLTGQAAEQWKNPITGHTVHCSQIFEEGPGCTTVGLSPSGLAISLSQPFAIVRGVEVDITERGGRIKIVQTERKQRGYPQEDGSLPEPGAKGTSEARTVLAILGSRGDVLDEGQNWAPASGSYEFGLNVLPPWMGFGELDGRTTVRGILHKTGMDHHINSTAWSQLQKSFPDYFENGRLRRGWC
jgi:hypothetical protein